jgi:hypothetical protein
MYYLCPYPLVTLWQSSQGQASLRKTVHQEESPWEVSINVTAPGFPTTGFCSYKVDSDFTMFAGHAAQPPQRHTRGIQTRQSNRTLGRYSPRDSAGTLPATSQSTGASPKRREPSPRGHRLDHFSALITNQISVVAPDAVDNTPTTITAMRDYGPVGELIPYDVSRITGHVSHS